jgi:predicted ATPase
MLMIGNLDAAEKAVRTLKIIAARHNATWWKTLVDCLDAKLLIKRGEFRNGVQLLQGALRTFKQAGWTVCYPEFSGALAEGVAGLGQTAEALETIDRALVQARSGGECWYVPELLRIKAELLIQADIDQSLSSAERCLNEGLDSARVQGALFWELRCALGLARLEKTTSLRTDARQTLAEVYGKFARGLDAADLQCSRALLDELSQDPSGARRPQ